VNKFYWDKVSKNFEKLEKVLNNVDVCSAYKPLD
jgi:hypothetical protein